MKKSTNIKSKNQLFTANESSDKCIWGGIDMSKEHYYCVILPGRDISKEIYDKLIQNKTFAVSVKDKKINVHISINKNQQLFMGVLCEVKQEYIDDILIGVTTYKEYVDKHFTNKLDKNKVYCLIPYTDEPICKFEINNNIKTLNDVYESFKSNPNDGMVMSECTSYTLNNKERIILSPFMCFTHLTYMTKFNKSKKPFIDIMNGIDIDNCEVRFKYPNDDYCTIIFNMKNSK